MKNSLKIYVFFSLVTTTFYLTASYQQFPNQTAQAIANHFGNIPRPGEPRISLFDDLMRANGSEHAKNIAINCYGLDLTGILNPTVPQFPNQTAQAIANHFGNIPRPKMPGISLFNDLMRANGSEHAKNIAINCYDLDLTGILNPTIPQFPNQTAQAIANHFGNIPRPGKPRISLFDDLMRANGSEHAKNIAKNCYGLDLTGVVQQSAEEEALLTLPQAHNPIFNQSFIGTEQRVQQSITPQEISTFLQGETTKPLSYLNVTGSTWGGNNKAIYFYEDNCAWGLFANTFASPVTINGRFYTTVEHFFQATKYKDQPLLEQDVLKQPTGGRAAWAGGGRSGKTMTNPMKNYYYNNNDAGSNVIMWCGIAHRIAQDKTFATALLATGNKILVENAGTNDANWGAGPDGKGKNKLGRMLMEMRALLQKGTLTTYIPIDVLARLP